MRKNWFLMHGQMDFYMNHCEGEALFAMKERSFRTGDWDEIHIFPYDLLYLTYIANFYGFDVVVSCCKVDSVTIFM